MQESVDADICLLLEGTYPYIAGGVSSWTHDLILSQPQYSFHLVYLLPPAEKRKPLYKIPENVIGSTHIEIQHLSFGNDGLSKKKREQFFQELELPLLNLLHKPSVSLLEKLLDILTKYPNLGRRVLLNSEEAWEMLLRIYRSTMGGASFLNFFWSWRSLLSGLFAVLLAPMPKARVYHSFCTGYAGLYLARAHMETGCHCLITEHGIYTNERRIEILGADWLSDQQSMNLELVKKRYEKNLKDLWIDMFSTYSTLAYEAADSIITLYEGNQTLQIQEGADPAKTSVIPNGIDIKKYSNVFRKKHPPTVALIGRVVPIKDIKTFIHAISILYKKMSDLRAFIIGPTDEDEEYYEECLKLTKEVGLDSVITYTGKVDIVDYLAEIDVLALTSLSEAQPLVILEAGACGIPSVATRVGSCQEIIMGRSDEEPQLGQGGIVCPLANPPAIAEAVQKLLTDVTYLENCGEVMQKRVAKYYTKEQQAEAYQSLYDSYMSESTVKAGAV